ncbi:MAG: diphthine--ammonia ligase [Cyclobacteriaceae bacterium]
MQQHKTIFNWSTGKDAALALYHLLQNEDFHVDHLLTAVNSHYDRVSMHGLRRELMQLQTQAVGIPSSTMELPEQPTMEEYEKITENAILKLKAEGFTHAGFGDIFLEDLKAFRVDQYRKMGMNTLFPIWKKDTATLIQEFLSLGFKAVVIAAKAEFFDETFVGKTIDQSFIEELPNDVDPCGENGEFHTFCYDGPIFDHPVAFDIGEKTYREYNTPKQDNVQTTKAKVGFWFCDLLPTTTT